MWHPKRISLHQATGGTGDAHRDGDIWTNVGAVIGQKGPWSIRVTKVKSHLTEDDVAHGKISLRDYEGNKKTLEAEGLLATCIQHEMDHLEGILFIDYLSKLKKSMIIKKLSKLKSSTAEV